MDVGAVVANPNRFNDDKLPDGSRMEVSALQHYYNEMADKSLEFCQCELDNNPPEETGPVESGITSHLILQHMSGYERCVVPPGCTIITQGIDVGKYALHYVVRAWKPDGTGYMIDKGVQTVFGTEVRKDIGVEHAIRQALRIRHEAISSGIYKTLQGESMPVDMTLIDSRYKQDAAYTFCREVGLGYRPAIGHGKSAGCVRPNFYPVLHSTRDKRPGFHSFETRQPKGVWLVNMETDYWKAWEHARWLTATDQPGTLFLYGTASTDVKRQGIYEREHFTYSKHVCAEVEVEEPIKGVTVRRWHTKSDTNHFFDASYMCDVAAGMKGIRILQSSIVEQQGPAPGGWFAAQESKQRRRRA